jgi:hypothetical protein
MFQYCIKDTVIEGNNNFGIDKELNKEVATDFIIKGLIICYKQRTIIHSLPYFVNCLNLK